MGERGSSIWNSHLIASGHSQHRQKTLVFSTTKWPKALEMSDSPCHVWTEPLKRRGSSEFYNAACGVCGGVCWIAQCWHTWLSREARGHVLAIHSDPPLPAWRKYPEPQTHLKSWNGENYGKCPMREPLGIRRFSKGFWLPSDVSIWSINITCSFLFKPPLS